MIFKIEQSNEYLTSQSGLALVGLLIKHSGLPELIDNIDPIQQRKNTFLSSDIAKSTVGLLSMAKTDFDDIEPFREDEYFAKALDLNRDTAPSSPTVRQRLDVAPPEWDKAALKSNTRLLKKYAEFTPCPEGYVFLNFDVSPMDNSDSKKEGVSRTYKKFDGFAPIFAYLGQNEGYMVNLEFREGKTHCQNGTPEFVRETIRVSHEITDYPLLSIFDSGNDDIKTIKACKAEGSDFIIKRNHRKESPDDWLWIAQTWGQAHEVRPGKTEYIGAIWVSHDELEDPVRIVFRVVMRNIDRSGKFLLIPEIEAESYWTLLELTPLRVIELYHLHGTSEQFHSEFKTDMDMERLPSGYFATNTRIMFLGMLAFNILRLIGQTSLEFDIYASKSKKVSRRRLKSVIQDFIYLACRYIANKANRCWLSFGRHCPYYEVFRGLYYRWAA